jgi:gliding motility-associated-like protein
MKNAFLIILLIGYSFRIAAQNVTLDWVKTFGNAADDYGVSIVADGAGNVYTVGTFVYTTDFDPGPGVAVAYTGGIFITKHDKNGNILWVKSVNGGGAAANNVLSIVLDKNGNICYGGIFNGTPDFDPGPGTFTMSSPGNGQSAFISKLDANGNFLWAGKIDNAAVYSVATDASGNVYATGSFEAVADFDPGPGVFNLTENSYTGIDGGNRDIFVLKLDGNGNFVWAKQMGGSLSDEGVAITPDPAGNVVLTGFFQGTADFDPGSGTNILTSSGGRDIFVAKLAGNGNFVWAKSMGGTSEDYGRCVSTDPAGNVYLSGYFYGTVDFDPGLGIFNLNSTYTGTDIYVSKLDANGNFIWAKELGGAGDDVSLGLCLDAGGNVYTTGSFTGIADFDPGPGVFNLTSNGYQDIFISKLDNNGNFIWAKSFGSAANEDVGRSIFVDVLNNIYTTGWFWGTVDFDPEAGVYNLETNGLADIFVQKLSQCHVTYDTLSITNCNSYTLNNQQYITSGTYVQRLTNSIGCDSIITLHLLLQGSNDTTAVAACDNYTWQNNTYSSSGFYRDTLINAFGCDSILNLNLIINKKSVDTITASICEGKSYYGYSLPGTYTDTLVAANGCDSIRTILLSVNKRSASSITATICEGENYEGYTLSGNYTDTLVGANGCDSIRTLQLLVHPKGFTTRNVAICEGESYFAGGANQFMTGVYVDSMHTVYGCDSIVTTDLTVNANPTPNLGDNRDLCIGEPITISPGVFNSYLWQDGSTESSLTINNMGTYWVKVTDKNNCTASDSFSIISIVPSPSKFLNLTDSICNYEKLNIGATKSYTTYLWSTGSNQPNITIQNPGVYSLTVTDGNGCSGTETITVFSKNCYSGIYVPDAFTPNGDGKNDVFRPLLFGNVKTYSFTIYNRFGRTVFQSGELLKGWDGSYKGHPQDGDIFLWVCRYQLDGQPLTIDHGSFLLIR